MFARLQALLAALWGGFLLCVAFVATPSAFAVLGRAQAGAYVARVFALEAQISLALGVAFAASILEVSSMMSGTHLQLADFHIAFTIVALVSLFAIVPIIRMDGNAGAAVSGHRGKVSQPAE